MKDFDISNMDETALISHATGQRHIKFMEMSVKGTVSISGIFCSSSAASQDQGSQAHTAAMQVLPVVSPPLSVETQAALLLMLNASAHLSVHQLWS